MKKLVSTILLYFIVGLFAWGQQPARLSVTVRVVDDDARPVANATIGAGFDQGGNAWIGDHRGQNIKGTTDAAGFFRASATGAGSIGVSARREGYYSWSKQLYFYRLGEEGNGPWQPFDPDKNAVTAVLHRVGNPIPMFAKRVDTLIPEVGAPCAYDLEKGDWVQPRGEGICADIVIELKRRITNEDDYESTLIVSVPGVENGILEADIIAAGGSALRLSPIPPIDGYRSNIVVRWGRTPGEGGYGDVGDDSRPNYFFRVRSEVDEKGGIIRTQYGKIYGAFLVSGLARENARISFLYYLNPTPNDRNVEFDPEQNLLTSLSSLEEVRAP